MSVKRVKFMQNILTKLFLTLNLENLFFVYVICELNMIS